MYPFIYTNEEPKKWNRREATLSANPLLVNDQVEFFMDEILQFTHTFVEAAGVITLTITVEGSC